MPNTDLQDFLMHHGVLGMHWGKHKANLKSSVAEEHSHARAVLKKPISSSTNKELEAANRRLSLERNFKDLKSQQTTIAQGHAKIKKILAITATIGAIAALTQTPTGKKVTNAGKNYLSDFLSGEAGKHVLIVEGAKHLA